MANCRPDFYHVKLPIEQALSAFGLLDTAGLSLELNKDLLNPIAREIAASSHTVYQKVYWVGQTHKLQSQTDKTGVKKLRPGLGP